MQFPVMFYYMITHTNRSRRANSKWRSRNLVWKKNTEDKWKDIFTYLLYLVPWVKTHIFWHIHVRLLGGNSKFRFYIFMHVFDMLCDLNSKKCFIWFEFNNSLLICFSLLLLSVLCTTVFVKVTSNMDHPQRF